MQDLGFSSVYGAAESMIGNVTTAEFLLCSVASIVLGAAVAAVYMFRHAYSKNFVVTLALLPLIVQMVITLVNGNLGAGIAVMGVFNLVRFRSIPDRPRTSAACFWPWPSALPRAWASSRWPWSSPSSWRWPTWSTCCRPSASPASPRSRSSITIPEDLDFDGVFDEVLAAYTSSAELVEVRTTNMGSLFQLDYLVRMKHSGTEKALIDDVRCLNGNCKVSLGRAVVRETL